MFYVILNTRKSNFAITYVVVDRYIHTRARTSTPLLLARNNALVLGNMLQALVVSLLSSPYLQNVDSYVIDTSVRAQRLLPGKKSPRLARLCSRARSCADYDALSDFFSTAVFSGTVDRNTSILRHG